MKTKIDPPEHRMSKIPGDIFIKTGKGPKGPCIGVIFVVEEGEYTFPIYEKKEAEDFKESIQSAIDTLWPKTDSTIL